MTNYRSKLHPSSCFPPNPSLSNIRNRLFIRVSSCEKQHHCYSLTIIGIDATTYATIAALLACRQSTSIERIKLFDINEKTKARIILNDLQLIGLFNKCYMHIQRVQSYWETKDSSIIVINVQHSRLENETITSWIQMNASLVENIVSQVCIYSPNATLIICTQPNELMTYVAARVSKFPTERILGLGGSITTACIQRAILNKFEKVHGHVNGCFLIGHGSIESSCTKIIMNNITIDGIPFSDITTCPLDASLNTYKLRSNWTEAMLLVHIIRALTNDKEFQSNFVVNIAPIYNSTDIFMNYPTIIRSRCIFPFRQAQNILQEKSFLIPFEKLQKNINPFKSKD